MRARELRVKSERLRRGAEDAEVRREMELMGEKETPRRESGGAWMVILRVGSELG